MASQRGYTLLECMIVSMLLIVVLGATLSLLDTSAQIAPQENERAIAVREAQVQLAGMVRELRQAHEVNSTTISATAIDARVPLAGGELRRVQYNCAAVSQTKTGTYRCRRDLWNAAGTAVESTTTAVDRLISQNVFEWNTNADGKVIFVEARIEIPASGSRAKGLDHTIVLDDGFFLRNVANQQ